MRNIWMVLCLFTFIFFIGCKQGEHSTSHSVQAEEITEQKVESSYELISLEKTKELLESDKKLSIIDVRTPEEFNSGAIANAQMINYRDTNFIDRLKELDRDKTYLVYCQSGGRSKRATDIMKDLKFKQVYELSGGYSSWK